ncbi:MAG: rhodanese-like domain-containing protein [Solirubrobacteraceae bacterium]
MPSVFDSTEIEVTTEQAAEALASHGAQVVDVRERYEWDEGRLDGVAHIEMERLASNAEKIDRERPVIFYCRLGSRSAFAAQAFRRAGYDAYSMAGGIQRWADEFRPMVPEGATVADH